MQDQPSQIAIPEPIESVVERLSQAKAMIVQAIADGDAAILAEIRSVASAVELKYQRDGARETANDAGEIKVRAERGLGQIDTAANPRGRPRKDDTSVNFSLDVREGTRAAWRQLGALNDREFEKRIGIARDDENAGISTTALLSLGLGGLKESVHVRWHTPARYIEAARAVLGAIDLDPASEPMANEIVKATGFFTEEDDGLIQDWHGRVWLNPPYGKGTGLFATKLIEEFSAERVSAAIFLINAYGFDSGWFQPLWNHPICFTDHRITFTSPDRETGGPANANIFVYLGPDEQAFLEAFSEFGAIVRRVA